MADGAAPLLAVLRFAAFSMVAVLGPGLALQRLFRVRWDPALVVPLGLLYAAITYGTSLVVGLSWLFPVGAVAANLIFLRPRFLLERASGPSLRGALPPLILLILLFGVTSYTANRVAADGSFHLERGEHIDAAVAVGMAWELVAGYPPQVPGLAGVERGYHLGAPLLRAAAARWADVHPYDSISRFDVTLWALGLVLVLRATAWALGLGPLAVSVAGFLPLAADLSFLPGLVLDAHYWAFKLSGNFVESVFYANSITPAMMLVLASLLALARAERGEGRGFAVLAALLGAGVPFFKVFSGAHLLLALLAAATLRRRGSCVWAVGGAAAASTALVAFTQMRVVASESVEAVVSPFALANSARLAFGMPEAGGALLLASGVVWLGLALGPRVMGFPGAVRAIAGSGAPRAVLGAFAVLGWLLGSVLQMSAAPSFNEAFYFVQAGGLALWLFAVPPLAGYGRRGILAVGAALLLTALPTAEFVYRKSGEAPVRIPASRVRAMVALREASGPGDIVLTKRRVAFVPLPVVLAGRRVTLAHFIPYWRQLTTPDFVAERERQVQAFFRAPTPAAAAEAARELKARWAYIPGPPRTELVQAGVLVPVFEEASARVYRIAVPGRTGSCR